MPEYRAFMVGLDGHILNVIELVCPNDESAKEYARQLVDGHELWQGERQIQTFSTRNVR